MDSRDVPLGHVLFDAQRLIVARLARGLRKAHLGQHIGVSPAAIGQYESGRIRPSPATVARLALTLGFPVGYFSRRGVIDVMVEDRTHFRRLRSTSRIDRSRASARVTLLQEFVAWLEEDVELPAVDIPEIALEHEDRPDPERAAEIVRQAWGLGPGPISHVVRLLEAHGCIVVRMPLGAEKIDAFSRWTGIRPIVVLTDDKDDAARSRFDAAHELGHLVMHQDASPGDLGAEHEANEFASAFLMPKSAILAELPTRVSWRRLFELKERWRVSLQALLYRARQLGSISDSSYRRAIVRMSANDWRRREPIGLGAAEEPVIVGEAVHLVMSSHEWSRARMADVAGLPLDLVDDFAPESSAVRQKMAHVAAQPI